MHAFWKFVTEDWYFAVPMFIMSATGLALLLWRLLLNLNGNTKMSEFLPRFQETLEREGVEGALKFCESRQDIIPRRLYVAGLENAKQGTSAMRRAMANAVELEILPDLNFLLPTILAIAKIATMVGLLGTVLSMIGTFSRIEQSGGGGVTKQAGSIGLALFATAIGLITAIPLAFSHVLLKAWVGRFEIHMKAAAQRLLLLVQAVKQPAAAPAPAPALAPAPTAPAAPARPGGIAPARPAKT
jgi:biopolymer transport protein ExbB